MMVSSPHKPRGFGPDDVQVRRHASTFDVDGHGLFKQAV